MKEDQGVAAADARTGTGPTVAELLEESAALTKALTGLTCNGSEFFIRKGDRYVADINACVSWVRRVKADAHRMTVDAIIDRKAADARAAMLLEALRYYADQDIKDGGGIARLAIAKAEGRS